MFSFKYLIRTVTVKAAQGDAEKIRLLGGADAAAIEAVGKAEAEMMRLKASAYKQYGDAAVLQLVLETLPKVRFWCNTNVSGEVGGLPLWKI